MGRAIPFDEDLPFEKQVKCLADEELLEMWAESQQIENLINAGIPTAFAIGPNFENVIINELNTRRTMMIAAKH